MPNYNRPPAVEALIDIRLERPLGQKQLGIISKKIKQSFPTAKISFEKIKLKVGATLKGPTVEAENSSKGFRLESKDVSKIAQLFPEHITLGLLAPYPGWEILKTEFLAVWSRANEVAQTQKNINRVATRFINRIDIPMNNNDDMIKVEDYLNFTISTPFSYTMDSLESAAMYQIDKDTKAIVRIASTASPLPNHAAFVLDLDVISFSNLPTDDVSLSERLEKLRDVKNSLFEQLITDHTRSLFNEQVL